MEMETAGMVDDVGSSVCHPVSLDEWSLAANEDTCSDLGATCTGDKPSMTYMSLDSDTSL